MHEIFERLKLFFALLVRLFNRLLCWRRNRNRRNSGSLLPTTVVSSGGGGSSPEQQSLQPQHPQYMYSSSSIVHSYTNNVNSTWNLMNQHPNVQTGGGGGEKSATAQQEEKEPDYFQDIQPTIKRQKKILIRNEEECKLSERLNFNQESNPMEDLSKAATTTSSSSIGNAWEEDSGLDELDIDQSLRDIRAVERERRMAEHRRIKLEKEQQKKSKRSNFMATKIS